MKETASHYPVPIVFQQGGDEEEQNWEKKKKKKKGRNICTLKRENPSSLSEE